MQTGVFFLGGYHLYLQLFSHYHLLLVYPGWWNMMTCTSWNWGHSTKGRGREELRHGDFVVPFVQKVHQKDLVRLVFFSSSSSRWWFEIFLEFFTPKLGEDEPTHFDSYKNQLSWNPTTNQEHSNSKGESEKGSKDGSAPLKKGCQWPSGVTPWKINMEPTNHPFIKENDLPNLHDYVPC